MFELSGMFGEIFCRFGLYCLQILGEDFGTCLGMVWGDVERLLDSFREGI